MRDFRFSSNVFGITSREEFVAACRDAESCGYDTIFCADHLGLPAPFPLLVAAAEATQRLRVGTLVLNVPFWNPALLAREVATTDILTEGRLELGLGSGHMKWEFDEAGIGWLGPSARAEKLRQMVTELQRFFSTDFAQLREGRPGPRPVQRSGFGGSRAAAARRRYWRRRTANRRRACPDPRRGGHLPGERPAAAAPSGSRPRPRSMSGSRSPGNARAREQTTSSGTCWSRPSS